MKRQKILRAVYLQPVSGCLQMTPDNNNSLKGIGKIRYYKNCKIKYCQLPPPQSHIMHGWNDNQCSLIAILQAVWCCTAFEKVHQHEKQGGREEGLLCRNVEHSHGWKLLLSCKLEQIWSHSTLYTFSSAGKNLYSVFYKMRNSKYNQKINIVWRFLLAEEIASVQGKNGFGWYNYYLDFSFVVYLVGLSNWDRLALIMPAMS